MPDVVATLSIEIPDTEKRTYDLANGETFRIGRDANNDLVLNFESVSRHHSILIGSPSGIVVSDLSSLNGTFLNSKPITLPTNVQSGDLLEIGPVKIQLNILGNEAAVDRMTDKTKATNMRVVVATVLLADVSGFTRMSEALPGDDVATMLKSWLEAVTIEVVQADGEVDKYIGDCVMAIWRGSPSDAKALAKKSISAAKAIQQQTMELAKNWRYASTFPWKCRISLHSGEALLGNIGMAGNRDFTVLGDSVNIAFRLEKLAGTLGEDIICSAETYNLLENSVPGKDLGSKQLEGRKEAVHVYGII